LPPSQVPLQIGFVGTGLIGKVTVKQMADRAPALLAASGLDLRLAGAADSKSMILASSDAGMTLSALSAAVAERVEDWDAGSVDAAIAPVDLDAFTAALIAKARACGGAAVVIDNTSSEAVADRYERWLADGVHVVTPNKKANSGALDRYERIQKAAKEGKAKWLVEGTIGAGLPVVSTLRTLRATGDEVRGVQGIFSGTMSFLFNTWDAAGGQPFSDVVKAAKEAGFTEPDPRDDLNGLDVARKVVIAARESGVNLSLDDVSVASLVPAELEDCDAAEYLRRLPEFDDLIAEEAREADAAGMVLRFVGKVDVAAKTGSVELAKFSKTHPFAGLEGADNIVEIQTARYGAEGESTPLIIRGPGAGAQVTAGGVFGDVCKLGLALGADVKL
jgi:aspartokinase/homoserine dehydrogenase 1